MSEAENKHTVLIVDDTTANIRVLNEVLKNDYRVLFATTGKEALLIATKETPDIVLLDIMMPDMDGYEVCRLLHQDPSLKDIPIIFITALDEAAFEARGLELGAVDYITKPINPNIARLRVKNHLELKLQRDLLARLSRMDGLTGAANRREFDEYVEKEWLRALRAKAPLSILMIDVDFFKAYNDRYGHPEGDACLKKVAAALKEQITRPADLVARYGGEEFACVLPGTDTNGAIHAAQKILEAVRALKLPHEHSTAAGFVTVSIGAASLTPDRGADKSTLIKAADDALYAAKAAGKDRVLAWGATFTP